MKPEPTKLGNEMLTNAFLGAAGSTLLVAVSESVRTPSALIYGLTFFSSLEAMLSHALEHGILQKVRPLAPIVSTAAIGALTKYTLVPALQLELSGTVKIAAITAASAYALTNAVSLARTGEPASLPSIRYVQEAPQTISSVFNWIVANPLQTLTNKVSLFKFKPD